MTYEEAPSSPLHHSAPDGTRLAYRRLTGSDAGSDAGLGAGAGSRSDSRSDSAPGVPLLCVPGGPADSVYLGDLGGLSAHRPLVIPDLRGTGRSDVPADPSSYRCDRLVEDIEALRRHLGLDRVDLLGHSAGANIATQYAARYPHRVRRLALVAPGMRAVGVDVAPEVRRELALARAGEVWFPGAFAALEAIVAGEGSDWEAIAPFLYGRWDEAARRHHVEGRPDNPEAVAGFGADGAFTPDAARAALAAFPGPVLLLAGAHDLNSPPSAVAEFAGLFPRADLTVQPGAGHYPWLDDPARFTARLAAFLSE